MAPLGLTTGIETMPMGKPAIKVPRPDQHDRHRQEQQDFAET
jgi:hypothetical protein